MEPTSPPPVMHRSPEFERVREKIPIDHLLSPQQIRGTILKDHFPSWHPLLADHSPQTSSESLSTDSDPSTSSSSFPDSHAVTPLTPFSGTRVHHLRWQVPLFVIVYSFVNTLLRTLFPREGTPPDTYDLVALCAAFATTYGTERAVTHGRSLYSSTHYLPVHHNSHHYQPVQVTRYLKKELQQQRRTQRRTSQKLRAATRRGLYHALKGRVIVTRPGAIGCAAEALATEALGDSVVKGLGKPLSGVLESLKKHSLPLSEWADAAVSKKAWKEEVCSLGAGGQGSLTRIGTTVIKTKHPAKQESSASTSTSEGLEAATIAASSIPHSSTSPSSPAEFPAINPQRVENIWSRIGTSLRVRDPHMIAPEGVIVEYDEDTDQLDTHFISRYLEAPDLFSAQKKIQAMDEKELRQLMAWTVMLVRDLNKVHIVHRDWKPDNILLHTTQTIDGCEVSIPIGIDFDYAAFLPKIHGAQGSLGAVVGTHGYYPPEMLEGEGLYGAAADLYSLGVTLKMIVAMWGQAPSADHREQWKELNAMTDRPFREVEAKLHRKLSDPFDLLFRQLLEKLLAHDPNQRPDFDGLKTDNFFCDATWQWPALNR